MANTVRKQRWLTRFLPLALRRWIRLLEVNRVALKHVIGFLGDQWQISQRAKKKRVQEQDFEDFYAAPSAFERFRLALEELGPTYVKLGQILSTRPDILPRELILELSKLQEKAAPFSYTEVREQILRNLGAPIEDIFEEFEKEQIAAASIGQVHYAVLKSGEEVILKVQRPGIRAKVEADISIAMWMAQRLEKYFQWARTYNAMERVREFGRFINEEMDYTTEARYCDAFRENFRDYEGVYIPKIYWEYTNQRILVMEFIHGIRVVETQKLDEAGFNKVEIAKSIGRAYAKMILEDGFFHADPHPGNILMKDEKAFALIDFGMVGRLDKETKGYIAYYFLALVNQDAPALTEILFKLYTIPKDVDRNALKREVGRLLSKYKGVPLGKVNLVEIVGELMDLMLRYQIKVPGEFTLFDKTFITLDGIGKQLAPDFDLLEVAKPFAQDFVLKQFSPRELAPILVKNALEIKDALLNLPRQINKMAWQLESGEFQVRVEQEKLQEEVERISSRVDLLGTKVPLGLALMGFLAAGCALYFIDFLKQVRDISVAKHHFLFFSFTGAAFCFYVAGFLGLWLFFSSVRKRN